jgi:hypothetical protein
MAVNLNKLYLLSISTWSFCSIVLINSHFLDIIDSRIYGAIATLIRLCFIFIIVKKTKGIKDIFKVIIILSIALIVYFYSESRWFYELSLILLASKDIERKQIAKKILMAQILVIIVVCGAYFIGLIDTTTLVRTSGRMRNALGFIHPNGLGSVLLQISVLYVYIRDARIRVSGYIVLCILLGICYAVVNSQTNVLLISLLLIGCIYFNFVDRKVTRLEKIKKWIPRVMCLAIMIVSIVCILFSAGVISLPGFESIDSDGTLMSRMQQMQMYYDFYGITWFGQPLVSEMYQQKKYYLFTLDNGYTYLILRYGLISYITYICSSFIIMKNAISGKNHLIILIMMLYAIVGLSETSMLKWEYNFTLFFFADLIGGYRKSQCLRISN